MQKERFEFPGTSSLRFGSQVFSFSELLQSGRRYASALIREAGLSPGDRIAVLAGSSPSLVAAFLGHLVSGLVHVPVNTRYRAAESAHVLHDSGASAVLVDSSMVETLEGAVRERPELGNLTRVLLDGAGSRKGDLAFAALAGTAEEELPCVPPSTPALMLFTSGTTGPAKGAVFSADALKAGIGSLMNLWGMSERDSLVLALPLFHVHGLCVGLLGSFFSGASIQLLPGFHVQEILEGIRGGGTVFMGVPTMYAFLLEHLETHAEDAKAMRHARLFTAGSAPLSPDHFYRFEALTGHRILERYGMTETLITLSNPLDGERRPGSVGFAVPGYETRVVDEAGADVPSGGTGELWVRGDGMMSGYHRNEEATRRSYTEGWFRTGDLATRDAERFHRILGRTSADLIKSGGFRIAAREIEEVLALHPEIKEIAVLGLPDPTWGERIVAAAVPRNRDRDPLELLDELSSLCERNLASYKKPRALALFDELPRNALGKILKHRIRESIVSGQTRLVSREG